MTPEETVIAETIQDRAWDETDKVMRSAPDVHDYRAEIFEQLDDYTLNLEFWQAVAEKDYHRVGALLDKAASVALIDVMTNEVKKDMGVE